MNWITYVCCPRTHQRCLESLWSSISPPSNSSKASHWLLAPSHLEHGNPEQCDKVPGHIKDLDMDLRRQMGDEWYSKVSVDELANESPQKFLSKFFLDSGSGWPDTSKTTDPVRVQIKSTTTAMQLAAAIETVDGLLYYDDKWHGAQARNETTWFIGWGDWKALNKVATKYYDGANNAAEEKQAESKREKAEKGSQYVQNAQESGATPSVVGTYILECEDIEQNEWSTDVITFPGTGDNDEMTMTVCETGTVGIFKASFCLRAIIGIMLLCADEIALEAYCTKLAPGDRDSDLDDTDLSNEWHEYSTDEEAIRQARQKRKAKT